MKSLLVGFGFALTPPYRDGPTRRHEARIS